MPLVRVGEEKGIKKKSTISNWKIWQMNNLCVGKIWRPIDNLVVGLLAYCRLGWPLLQSKTENVFFRDNWKKIWNVQPKQMQILDRPSRSNQLTNLDWPSDPDRSRLTHYPAVCDEKPISILETGTRIPFFQSHVRDMNESFFLSISCFETRTRINFFLSRASRRERESRLRQFSREFSGITFIASLLANIFKKNLLISQNFLI